MNYETHRRTEPIVGQLNLQPKISLEQRFGKLLDSRWLGKVQLAIRLESIAHKRSASG